jgi:hypothetical protein
MKKKQWTFFHQDSCKQKTGHKNMGTLPQTEHVRYRLITGQSLPEIEENVNKALREGWELQGGVSSFLVPGSFTNHAMFSQAVVKNPRPHGLTVRCIECSH